MNERLEILINELRSRLITKLLAMEPCEFFELHKRIMCLSIEDSGLLENIEGGCAYHADKEREA